MAPAPCTAVVDAVRPRPPTAAGSAREPAATAALTALCCAALRCRHGVRARARTRRRRNTRRQQQRARCAIKLLVMMLIPVRGQSQSASALALHARRQGTMASCSMQACTNAYDSCPCCTPKSPLTAPPRMPALHRAAAGGQHSEALPAEREQDALPGADLRAAAGGADERVQGARCRLGVLDGCSMSGLQWARNVNPGRQAYT